MIRTFDEPAGKNPRELDPRSPLRAIERALASQSNAPSDRAQDLFYEAMDAPTDEEELALLEKAATRILSDRIMVAPSCSLIHARSISTWSRRSMPS